MLQPILHIGRAAAASGWEERRTGKVVCAGGRCHRHKPVFPALRSLRPAPAVETPDAAVPAGFRPNTLHRAANRHGNP
jgi:hypothetical protein